MRRAIVAIYAGLAALCAAAAVGLGLVAYYAAKGGRT